MKTDGTWGRDATIGAVKMLSERPFLTLTETEQLQVLWLAESGAATRRDDIRWHDVKTALDTVQAQSSN